MQPAFIARPISLLRMQCPAAIRTPPGAYHGLHRLEAVGTIRNVEIIHPAMLTRLTSKADTMS